MSLLSKRTSAPLAVLALAAVPLLAPAGANAAMAGALPTNSSQAPDLQSATATIVGNDAQVRYCFNKNLGSSVNPNTLTIGTYDQVVRTANTAVVSGQCVTATFVGLNDVTTYTYGSVAVNAVVNLNLPQTNNADSTALIGSNTNNGTRSRSTAPDLTGVTVSGSSVTFSFDEAVAFSPKPDQFTLVDNNAKTIQNANNQPAVGQNASLSSDRKSVTVDFSLSPTVVLSAARAVYTPGNNGGNVQSASSGKSTPTSSGSTPTSNGTTTEADPTGATLVNNGSSDQIDVAFDQAFADPSAANGINQAASKYAILLSDGTTLSPAASGTNAAAAKQTANTVRLTVPANNGKPALRNVAEYVVGVVVLTDGALRTTADANANPPVVGTATQVANPGTNTPTNINTVGVVPAGGNAGALATGYTVAPEVTRLTLDGSTNTATITLDQRDNALANAGRIYRIDNTGSAILNDTPVLSFPDISAPGQITYSARFQNLSGTRALGFFNVTNNNVTTAAFTTATGAQNVPQTLAPNASTAG